MKCREPQNYYEQLVHDGTLASYEENKYKTLYSFNLAIQHSPQVYLAYLKRGIEFFNLSLKNRAIEDFERSLNCIQKYPQEQPFYGNDQHAQQLELILNGLIAEVNGDIAQSKALYEQACSLHENKNETKQRLNSLHIQKDVMVCDSANSSGGDDGTDDETRRREQEERRKQLIDDEIDAIEELEDDLYTSYAYFSLGFVQCSLSDYHHAVISYRKSIAFGPMHSTCIHYNNLGFCLECLDKKDEAYMRYLQSLEANSRCLKSMFNIAKMLNQQKQKYDEAMVILDKIFAIDPSQQDVWIEKGEIYLNQGRTKEAEQCFEKAVRIDPSVSYAYVRLASAKLFHVIHEMEKKESNSDTNEDTTENNAHLIAWSNIVNTIIRTGKYNMTDDQEVLKFHVFERVITQSLRPDVKFENDDGTEDFNEDEALKNLEQGNLKKFLGTRQRIFPPETRFNRTFKQALLCCTNVTYYESGSDIDGNLKSPATPLRSPLSPNGFYEYYFEQYAVIHDRFADCFIYFQS
jgi:tetratricopeptide (TPR) repeat protein